METGLVNKVRSTSDRPFRFRLRSIFVLTVVVALPLWYVAINSSHWNAVRKLNEYGVNVVYRREEESLLDKCLGIYRLDEIDHLSKTRETEDRLVSDFSCIKDLRSLDYFDDEMFYDPSERYDFLLPISEKIKHLSFKYLPKDSVNFLSHFSNVEFFYTGSDLDFNGLPKAFPVTSIYIRAGLPKNIRPLPNLRHLKICKGGQALKPLKLAELSHLHLKSIWLENTSIQVSDTASGIENFMFFDILSGLIIVDKTSSLELISLIEKQGGVPILLSELIDGKKESKWISIARTGQKGHPQ